MDRQRYTIRKKEIGIGLLLILLCMSAMSACGKKSQDAAGQAEDAQSAQESAGADSRNDGGASGDAGGAGDEDGTTDASSEDGAVTDAPFAPESVMDAICGANGIVDTKDGFLLVTDLYNKVVWSVDAKDGSSAVYAGGETIADLYGEPVGGYNDAGILESYFQAPWAIAPFLDGWAVADADNNAVRLISQEKVMTANGTTTEKLVVGDLGVVFDHPTGLAADGEGNLYVSDSYNGAIRKITKDGKVSTVAKDLEDPTGLCFWNGTLYVAETGANRILKITGGKAVTVAGCGENGYADGAAEDAAFSYPQGLAIGDDGTIYVSDTGNSAIRRIKDGQVSTRYSRDRTQTQMDLISPVGVLYKDGALYICDSFTRKVLRMSAAAGDGF